MRATITVRKIITCAGLLAMTDAMETTQIIE
jgi:hypothetical protein